MADLWIQAAAPLVKERRQFGGALTKYPGADVDQSGNHPSADVLEQASPRWAFCVGLALIPHPISGSDFPRLCLKEVLTRSHAAQLPTTIHFTHRFLFMVFSLRCCSVQSLLNLIAWWLNSRCVCSSPHSTLSVAPHCFDGLFPRSPHPVHSFVNILL